MRSIGRPVLGITLATVLAGCTHGVGSVTQNAGAIGSPALSHATGKGVYFEGAIRPDGAAEVCARPQPGFASCHSLIRLDQVGPDSGAYGPADLISAYKLPPAPPSTQTVAVVDAFDDPNAEADLGVYRSHFGLSACTTSNGCFSKVNEAGNKSPLPRGDVGWAVEMSLDVDMVSAICPACHILLVEGNSNSFSDLATSVDTAAALGANAISNSYGGGESGGFGENSHYKHPGHMITASSGDNGYGGGPQFPADSDWVTAVGGTSLMHGMNARGWTETAWSGAGSGCSTISPKPAWQHDPLCTMRTISDVSADAAPFPGVVVYDSYGEPGFISVGGTSASSPMIASVYALKGNAGALNFGSRSYSHLRALYDITMGANGSCGGTYLCTAVPGYDGPTGNGTPKGVNAF